jgi:hypothetical protein
MLRWNSVSLPSALSLSSSFEHFFHDSAASNSWQAYAICLLDVWMSEGTPEILDINDVIVGELAERGEWVLANIRCAFLWSINGRFVGSARKFVLHPRCNELLLECMLV